MPDDRPLATHRMITVPDYRLITLNDQDKDAGPGSPSLEDAARNIAASDGYTLVISVTQDLLPVGITVTIQDTAPHTTTDIPHLHLECPTGQLALGSPTGSTIGIDVEPGTYSIAVEHQGRDAASARRQEILHRYTSSDDFEALVDATPLTEQYTITMWRTGDVQDIDQNEVQFSYRPRDERGVLEVVPRVDGTPLTDLIDKFETDAGMRPSGDAYGGLVPQFFRFGPMEDHFHGRPGDAKTPLLGCECGEWGCWPLLARITTTDDLVIWDAFEQPHRPARDYTGFGPFRFDRHRYDDALGKLSRAVDEGS
ncbi:hypothetical protein ACFWMR_31440 [Amycolatopsis thailandensis]|uniref:hypothetical protein n=1 Tax=Amycolatopsis thailandensis TaxID=589330 RepID=UPI003652531C